MMTPQALHSLYNEVNKKPRVTSEDLEEALELVHEPTGPKSPPNVELGVHGNEGNLRKPHCETDVFQKAA